MKDDKSVKRKVLIADDDEDSRIMLAFLLQDEGWQIAEARNGKEALEKVVQEKPNIIILDNRMPELTGVEVYQHLQKTGNNIPVVLITAFGDLEELASAFGIRYYLKKPIDFMEVLAKIESAYTENS